MLGYQFQRIEFLEEALNQQSCHRLALVGDRVLAILLASRWYSAKDVPHQWNEIISQAMANVNLQDAAVNLGIHKLVTPSLADKGVAELRKRKIMADAVEALIGAVFEDSLAAGRTIEWDTLETVIFRFGIVPEFLVKSNERRIVVVRTSRMLPRAFFKGHQTALNDALFDHGTADTTSVPLPKRFIAMESWAVGIGSPTSGTESPTSGTKQRQPAADPPQTLISKKDRKRQRQKQKQEQKQENKLKRQRSKAASREPGKAWPAGLDGRSGKESGFVATLKKFWMGKTAADGLA